MLVYCLLTKKEIIDVMSSKILELNINDGILYTKSKFTIIYITPYLVRFKKFYLDLDTYKQKN